MADTVVADLKFALTLLRRARTAAEPRPLVTRALRMAVKFRPLLTDAIVTRIVTEFLKRKSVQESLAGAVASGAQLEFPFDALEEVEVELFVQLLVVMFLIDSKKTAVAAGVAQRLANQTEASHRRSTDVLAARVYFFLARASELEGASHAIRGQLHNALRKATLRHDIDTQATVMNILVRNYLQDNLVEQAHLLLTKATFPAAAATNEAARHHYYLGRIGAVQLDYSDAQRNLLQATRKAPRGAVGFLQTAHKLSIIVDMLLGSLPDRSLFRQPTLRRALAPYLELTQAVRSGDLTRFTAALATYDAVFKRDGNYTLILRLRRNVIKSGLRALCLAYSRIALSDVAARLKLDSAEDAEYIVAKAIRDGVIEASINHAGGYLESKEVVDLYATNEPQHAFHERAAFCMRLHTDCVKALRFPPNSQRNFLESSEQRRERELQEAELAEELEGDEDF